MEDALPYWLVPAALAALGACIGSFLNVVIYRSPLGMSLSDPSRSFCPSCGCPIPWYLNIPLVSWLVLRGKCAACTSRIPVRYWLVELLTASLFLAVAFSYDYAPVATQFLICLWLALAVVVSFIDGEHMIVFPRHTLIGGGVGLLAAVSYPTLVEGMPGAWTEGLALSLIGALAGFVLIRLVIELGKILFGSWKQVYDVPSEWSLKEPESDHEELVLVLPDRECPWSELFARSSDKVVMGDATLVIDGKSVPAGTVTLFEDRIETAEGGRFDIERIESAGGTLKEIRANREAMGSGDAWIMLMVGSLCGWEGCVFTLICACFISLAVAVVGKLGFGRPMPFGPSLLLGAAFWLFYGKQLWIIYLNWAAV